MLMTRPQWQVLSHPLDIRMAGGYAFANAARTGTKEPRRMYVHKEIAAIDLRRYHARVTVTDLAWVSGLNRRRVSSLLNGPSEREMKLLLDAITALENNGGGDAR